MCEKKRHLCGSKAHLSAVRTIGAFNVPIGDKGARRLHAKEGAYESTGAPHTRKAGAGRLPACKRVRPVLSIEAPVKPIGVPLRSKRALACEKGHM